MIQNILAVAGRLTADDWELYRLPGRDEAAAHLSKALREAMLMDDCQDATRHIYRVMKQYQELGATDTEGCYVMDKYISHMFDFE